MFMPDTGKPTAYPTRTETTFRRTSRRRNTQRVFLCRGGRRVGMQACPFGSSLAQTTTKYAQESLRALSFRKRRISPPLKASPECPLRDMRQASRLGDGWHYGDARLRGLFRLWRNCLYLASWSRLGTQTVSAATKLLEVPVSEIVQLGGLFLWQDC